MNNSTPPPPYTHEQVLEQTEYMKNLLQVIDMSCLKMDVKLLKLVSKEVRDKISVSESISFIVGGNDFREEKARGELKTLDALILLIQARKEQAANLITLAEKESKRMEVFNQLKNIL